MDGRPVLRVLEPEGLIFGVDEAEAVGAAVPVMVYGVAVVAGVELPPALPLLLAALLLVVGMPSFFCVAFDLFEEVAAPS